MRIILKEINHKKGISDIVSQYYPTVDCSHLEKYGLGIYVIESWAKELKVEYEFKEINSLYGGNWENDDDDVIFEILGLKEFFKDDNVFILTDWTERKKCIPLINYNHLLQYIDIEYFEEFEVAFFQPSDTVFFSEKMDKIFFIHHEGHFAKFIFPRLD